MLCSPDRFAVGFRQKSIEYGVCIIDNVLAPVKHTETLASTSTTFMHMDLLIPPVVYTQPPHLWVVTLETHSQSQHVCDVVPAQWLSGPVFLELLIFREMSGERAKAIAFAQWEFFWGDASPDLDGDDVEESVLVLGLGCFSSADAILPRCNKVAKYVKRGGQTG